MEPASWGEVLASYNSHVFGVTTDMRAWPRLLFCLKKQWRVGNLLHVARLLKYRGSDRTTTMPDSH